MKTVVQPQKALRAGWGLMGIGLCFLFNPHVNVIDVLPDCVGWLFAALSMTYLAYVSEEIAAARRRVWILFGITLVKLAPMVFSLIGDTKFPLLAEPTMVLTYTVCFGAFEAFLGMSVFRIWLDMVSQIGLLGGSKRSIRGTEGLRILQVFFFVFRFAASVIPELVYLRSTEYLGNVVYGVVIDIRDYRPYLIIFFSFLALVMGIGWLVLMLRYLRTLRQDEVFQKALSALSAERQTEIICKSTLERFHIAFAMMFTGGVFLCYFSFENVNLLPDCIGLALLTFAVYLLRNQTELPVSFFRVGMVGVVLTIPYYIVRTWHSVQYHGFWADNLADYFQQNIAMSAEKQSHLMQLQLIMLALSVLETVVVILVFKKYLGAVNHLNRLTFDDGHTLYDSMTHDMMRSEKEKYERLPKRCFLLFGISAVFEIIRTLPVFSFVITPIAVIRNIVNVIFLCMFYRYLMSMLKMVEYHYTYHMEPTDTIDEKKHTMLH